MHIAPSARISRGVNIDTTYPQGVYIGEDTFFSGNNSFLTHDFCRNIHADTRIGNRCFVGSRAIIMPGVSIGDECIIGAGSVVTHDVPSNSIVAGVPARIIRSGIHTKKFGQIILLDEYNETNKQ